MPGGILQIIFRYFNDRFFDWSGIAIKLQVIFETGLAGILLGLAVIIVTEILLII